MTVLVYIGANVGSSLGKMVGHYDNVYAFEPDPEMFDQLKANFGGQEKIHLVNAACSDKDGEENFYVTPNRVSSSLSDISEWDRSLTGYSGYLKKITVKTIDLNKYLKEQNIDYIDYYLSDAQGSDLNILKNIKSFVDSKKIGELFIETHGNNVFIYEGLDNQFDGFKEILSDNYNFVYASIDGRIVSENEIPEGEKEWDSYWIKKDQE
jgi:hypothetical protein